MQAEVAHEWTFDVERGPDWLFIRVGGPYNGDAEGLPLAEMIWDLMQQHFTHRVVLDLSRLRILRSYAIGQLVQLHKRVHTKGGLMRIAGLSVENYNVLIACRLHERFPPYATLEDAVMGRLPEKSS
jgi:anti-anti-sigma factor